MKRLYCIGLIISLFSISSASQNPAYVNKLLNKNEEYSRIYHIAKTGNKIFGIGSYKNGLLAPNEIFKLTFRLLDSEHGSILDTLNFDPINKKNRSTNNVKINQDKLFIVGSEYIQFSESQDIFLAVFDADRNLLWERSYGIDGRWERGMDLTFDSQDNIIIGGKRSIVTATNRLNSVIIKTDSFGELIWEREIAGSVLEFKTESVVVDGEDNIYAFGNDDSNWPSVNRMGISKYTADGDSLWTKFYDFGHDAGEMKFTSDDNLIISSQVFFEGASLTKLNLDGELIWSKSYSDYVTYNIRTLKETSQGDYALLGSSEILLVKAKTGELIQSRSYFDEFGVYEAQDLLELDDDSFLVTGSFWNTPNTNDARGVWLLRTDALFKPLSFIYPANRELNINVFPNPTTSLLHIENDSDHKFDSINLLDVQGKILGSYYDKLEIDISSFPSGSYYLNFKDGVKIIGSKKIVKL